MSELLWREMVIRLFIWKGTKFLEKLFEVHQFFSRKNWREKWREYTNPFNYCRSRIHRMCAVSLSLTFNLITTELTLFSAKTKWEQLPVVSFDTQPHLYSIMIYFRSVEQSLLRLFLLCKYSCQSDCTLFLLNKCLLHEPKQILKGGEMWLDSMRMQHEET